MLLKNSKNCGRQKGAAALELDASTVAAAKQRVGSPAAVDSRVPHPQGSEISVHVADALAPNLAALGLQGVGYY